MFLHPKDGMVGELFPGRFIIFKCEVIFSVVCLSCENSYRPVCEFCSTVTPHLPEREAAGNAPVLQCFQPSVFWTSQESYICSLLSCVVQSWASRFPPEFFFFFLGEQIVTPLHPLLEFFPLSLVTVVLSAPWLRAEKSISVCPHLFNPLSTHSPWEESLAVHALVKGVLGRNTDFVNILFCSV